MLAQIEQHEREPMKQTTYVSRKPDDKGFVDYPDTEHQTWHTLYDRQIALIKERACDEFIEGIELLNLTADRIPQIPDVNAALAKTTGWTLEPVAALISIDKFFQLLAAKKFPVATFIRRPEDLDYIEEPDIFHEIFGHCPLLTNPAYADFTEAYGKLALQAEPNERMRFGRLYWFTIEFGLLQTQKSNRIYGGGILSSKEETVYALDSTVPECRPFDLMKVLRTPYRIDILQTVYYVIENYEQLHELTNMDLLGCVREAMRLGDFPPTYNTDKETEYDKPC
jgi:phenylalanine-4-hydroxylase